MNGALRLGLALALQFLSGAPGRDGAPRLILGNALIVGGFLAAVVAGACATAALWIAAFEKWGPVGAPLVTGGVVLAAAAGLFLAGHLLTRRKPAPQPELSHIEELMKSVDAGKILREHKFELLLATSLLGLMVGGSVGGPKRR